MIWMTGTDYKLAPLEIRALFSRTRAEQTALSRALKQNLGADGVVLLMTCNRAEVWVSAECSSIPASESGSSVPDRILEAFCELLHLDFSGYRGYFRGRCGREAEEHLFSLTCGLESAILAEDQILTQVRNARTGAQEAGTADSALDVLFRMAVTAAKRVKTEVRFERADSSAVTQAVSVLRKSGFFFPGARCMVIGNGMYGKLAAAALAREGADVTVTIRSYHSGVVTVPPGCGRIPYSSRLDFLPSCQLVVSATASPHLTLRREDVERLMLDHEVIFLDFAVPPDIDSGIGALPHCRLYNIDDFRTEESAQNRAAASEARALLKDGMKEYEAWKAAHRLAPEIEAVRTAAAQDFLLRARKDLRALPLSEADRDVLEKNLKSAAERAVNRLIYGIQDHATERAFEDAVRGLVEEYRDG